jgi:succinoglycan biosynthesis transport protein ExoP
MNQFIDQEEIQGFDFLKVFKRLKDRKWSFLSVVFLFLAIGLFYVVTATPVYQADSTILIGTQTSDQFAGKGKQFAEVDPTNTEFYKTQYALLQSRTVIKNVIEKLNLLEDDEFKPKPPAIDLSFIKDGLAFIVSGVNSLFESFGLIDQSMEAKNVSIDPTVKLIGIFQKRLKISPVSQSHVVRIGYEGYSPERAAIINNAFLDQLRVRNINRRTKVLAGSEKWMKEKIEDLKVKMGVAEVKLSNFRKKNNIIDFKKNREISAQNLSKYQDGIRKVQTEKLRLSELKNLLIQLKADPVNLLHKLPDSVKTKTAAALVLAYAELVKEYNEMTNEYSSLHPKVQILLQKIKSMESSVPQEIDRLIASIDIDFKGTVLHEKSMDRAMRGAKAEIMQMDNQEFTFNALSNELETHKVLHNDLLTRFKEIDIASYSSESSIQIVDRAETPLIPIRPKKGFSMFVFLVMGVFGGSFWILFLERINKTVITVEDVVRQIPFPFLGATGIIDKKDLPLPIVDDSNTFIAEEFRTVKTNLMMNGFVDPCKVLMVSSSTPSEGKTTVITNLAATFAQDGKKVLVIEADFTRPKIAGILKINNNVGLLDILGSPTLFKGLMEGHVVDSKKIDKMFLKSCVEGVYVLPKGNEKGGYHDILNYGVFEKILTVTRKVFDVVLIDTPPALAFSYISVVAKLADGVLFVIGSGMKDKALITKTLDKLSSATGPASFIGRANGQNGQNRQNGQNGQNGHSGSNAQADESRIFGVVLNKVKYQRDEHYMYHRKYFKEYYSPTATS